MTIRAVSQVSFAKKNQPAQASVKESKNKTSENNSSFKLPGYNVSFGMARIDVQDFIKKKQDNEKYFKPDEQGYIAAAYMDENDLSDYVKELQEKDPELVIRLFTTKNTKSGDLIAHAPGEGVLAVMNTAMENLPDKYKEKGKEVLNKIYMTPNRAMEFPAHTFERREDVEAMYKAVGHEKFKDIMLTRGRQDELPAHHWPVDGMQSFVLDSCKKDKDFLEKIFFATDENAKTPKLRGYKDIASWCDVFAYDFETLEQKFKSSNRFEKSLKNFVKDLENEDNLVCALESALREVNPELLRDIYTLETIDGESFTDLIDSDNREDAAKSLFNLITKSDLSDKDSLEVLEKNEIFMKNNKIENLDLVKEHLEKVTGKSSKAE